VEFGKRPCQKGLVSISVESLFPWPKV
jgi:hypothetical protein